MTNESIASSRDRRTRRREGRRLGRRDSVHQARPVEIVRPPDADQLDVLMVARAWSDALSAADVEAAVGWYAPEAVLHHEGEVLIDPASFRARWAHSSLLGVSPDEVALAAGPTAATDGFDALVRWSGRGEDGGDVESRLRIRGGSIVEQWHGEVRRFEPAFGPPLEVSTAGSFSDAERAQFTSMMWRVIGRVEPEVRRATLRLEHHLDPARPAHFSARAALDMDHQRVHARASAPTVGALIDRIEHRLFLQLEERADRERALRRRGTASPAGQWRHGDRPQARPRVAPRPDDEREVFVRSTWSAGAEHVDEALDELEALDLEVLLFEEAATGQPAVVWFGDDGRGRVRLASGEAFPEASRTRLPEGVVVEEQPFALLDLDSARSALDLGEPWVAFRDRMTGQAGVLYRRIDGHDGLVVLETAAFR